MLGIQNTSPSSSRRSSSSIDLKLTKVRFICYLGSEDPPQEGPQGTLSPLLNSGLRNRKGKNDEGVGENNEEQNISTFEISTGCK